MVFIDLGQNHTSFYNYLFTSVLSANPYY